MDDAHNIFADELELILTFLLNEHLVVIDKGIQALIDIKAYADEGSTFSRGELVYLQFTLAREQARRVGMKVVIEEGRIMRISKEEFERREREREKEVYEGRRTFYPSNVESGRSEEGEGEFI